MGPNEGLIIAGNKTNLRVKEWLDRDRGAGNRKCLNLIGGGRDVTKSRKRTIQEESHVTYTNNTTDTHMVGKS